MIVEVLKAHCQVKLDQDQGPLSGVKKKTAGKFIHMLTSVGPAPPAEDSAAESETTLPCPGDIASVGSGDGGPAAAAEAPATEEPAPAAMDAAAAGEAAAAAKWGDASEVFGGF